LTIPADASAANSTTSTYPANSPAAFARDYYACIPIGSECIFPTTHSNRVRRLPARNEKSFPRPLSDCQLLKQRTVYRLKPAFDSQGKGPLERMLKIGDGVYFLLRPNQKMYIFRYKYKAGELDIMDDKRLVQRFGEPATEQVVGQKLQTAIARKCYKMQVHRFVEMLHAFAVRIRRGIIVARNVRGVKLPVGV
jgi:hypothetical protein